MTGESPVAISDAYGDDVRQASSSHNHSSFGSDSSNSSKNKINTETAMLSSLQC